jgi:hypothetical protein
MCVGVWAWVWVWVGGWVYIYCIGFGLFAGMFLAGDGKIEKYFKG